jgi:hypothetical protein
MLRSTSFLLISAYLCITFFFKTSFSFLDNLRVNSSVGPEKLPLTISSSILLSCNELHSQNIAPIGEGILCDVVVFSSAVSSPETVTGYYCLRSTDTTVPRLALR